ncbi:MAG TPA: glycosyltransferase family 4 protein [Nitrososphaerales archaeon]|nr:glycosyltransferase family 4 protein [Nitrososphaerales archaeon]
MNIGVIMYQTSASKGQELVAQRMTKALASQGDRAVLITSRFHDFRSVISEDEVGRNHGYVGRKDKGLGLEVYRVDSRKVDWPPRRIEFANFISIIDRIAGELELDVLITHSTLWNGPDLTAQFVSWKRRMLARSGGKQLIFCHMSHFQPPSRERYSLEEREWRRTWNDYVLKRIIGEADFLLVTTPKAERHMVELGATREQCVLFPGGIEVPQKIGPEELDEFRRMHGFSPEENLVTFLGTVEERKNVGAIVKAAKMLEDRPDIRFVIAGRMEGEYSKEIRKRSREIPNLSILGEISEEEKAALIRSSCINLTMSRLEALGLAQLEFMSAGVPVVTSGVEGQTWVIKNRHTGIVLRGPQDTSGAIQAITTLLDDQELRTRLGRNAEKFASGFTMKALVKKLMVGVRKKLEA